MDMRIVLTGASGFIGSAFLDQLKHRGDLPGVVCLAHSGEGANRLRLEYPEIGMVMQRSETEKVEEVMQGADAFIHLAWSTVPRTADADPARDLHENVESGIVLIDLAKSAGVGRFIFISSGGSVYGPQEELPITEDSPALPIGAYGTSKLCFEHYLQAATRHGPMDHIILRPGNIYGRVSGPKRPQGVIEHWMRALLEGRPLEVWGDLRTVRDYVYVDDMVRVLEKAVTYSGPHSVFNVGSGTGTSLAQLLELLKEVTGLDPQIIVHGEPVATVAEKNILDPRRLESEFSVLPAIPLREGLAKLWARLSAVKAH
jgi:UDP-glucose 4-epimerase